MPVSIDAHYRSDGAGSVLLLGNSPGLFEPKGEFKWTTLLDPKFRIVDTDTKVEESFHQRLVDHKSTILLIGGNNFEAIDLLIFDFNEQKELLIFAEQLKFSPEKSSTGMCLEEFIKIVQTLRKVFAPYVDDFDKLLGAEKTLIEAYASAKETAAKNKQERAAKKAAAAAKRQTSAGRNVTTVVPANDGADSDVDSDVDVDASSAGKDTAKTRESKVFHETPRPKNGAKVRTSRTYFVSLSPIYLFFPLRPLQLAFASKQAISLLWWARCKRSPKRSKCTSVT